jgi:hypothetical protein
VKITLAVADDNDQGYSVVIHAHQLPSRTDALDVARIALDDIFEQVSIDSNLPSHWTP